ncbi:GNAT family N-acetyltransferase [Cryptosporangium phraense]|uniref:GNAT family N-acetyltransferase n=1 Tax=Cryptosporangium phraense TaxID=2593070 RepID=A0A545ALT4_9ACTN|nr:GNAT family N-acetyltransferase [Cryptosporangium phraense]TQS42284.1 GNAT family N-acetyltransferase [Cryptosporangium phraense]
MTTSSHPPPVGVITIRKALPAEFAEIGALTYNAYASDGLLANDSGYADELRDAEHRANHCDLLVAADERGRLLGTVTFCLPGSPYAELSSEGQAEFRMLAVAPEHRGRGVGARLVRECLDLATKHHATSIVLSTKKQMHTAQRLYERFGFHRTEQLDWSPTPDVELLAYAKPL